MKLPSFLKKTVSVGMTVDHVLAKAGVPVASQVDFIISAVAAAAQAHPASNQAADAYNSACQQLLTLKNSIELTPVPSADPQVLKKKFTITLMALISALAALVSYKLGVPIELVSHALTMIAVLGAGYVGVEGMLDHKSMGLPPAADPASPPTGIDPGPGTVQAVPAEQSKSAAAGGQ